ncbi:MAG: transporter substrate-binding domain-containing protein, partial [Clostridia bacterium]|nr:transporter substrate-binding domain-containing protein [Clostridia bacterium]
AAKQGTTGTTYAESIKDQYGFTLTYFEDSRSMYDAVIAGSAAACFEDFAVVGWGIKNDNLSLEIIGNVVNPGFYGFAVKKGHNSELLEMFNEGLKNIKANGKYEEILARYGC